ncbi:hypothetical protein [Mycolicibacterium litorale]|uniref:Uncharacterized protein n=1 Tax=Mycolicibacterium litorale TaxID=758802 RepID=A0AAD1IPJ0_9MYCO|nr:hypothetical protein [Mycolicibacterium litorale]MCV7414410.1 hypothetical protein [Mycolicibacterium litorale]TDY01394.1 hypothetical protein BCL50_4873 [Mycolicibacterium litorale]BBY15393.1 hypothetical protein MLIT_09850 [Mycolicibacterium litorale]
MTDHPDLGPELRALAQAILARVDPVIRFAAARASSADQPGSCQQVWCPVCALAALIQDEKHPLLDIVAEHSVALLNVLRALVDDIDAAGPPPQPPPPPPSSPPPPDEPPPGPGRYQHIPVTVQE